MDLNNYKENESFNTELSNPFENTLNTVKEQPEHNNQQQYDYNDNQSRDYSKYYVEENRLRELLAIKQKRQKVFRACITTLTIIIMLAIAIFVQLKSKSSILNTYILKHNNLEKVEEKDNHILVEDIKEEDIVEEDNNIIDGDYVYRTINLETENPKSLVNIDSEVIEETLYKTDRLLYFKVMPKIDYVSTLINVYAYDENGNQIEQSATRLNNIAPNQEALVQVAFKFDATKYTKVTYKSECIQFENMDYNDEEKFRSEYNPYRRITNITEDEENITIIVSGDNVNKPIFVVFYKDGQISRILGTYNDSMTKGTVDIVLPSFYIAHDSFTVFLS